MAEKLTLTQKLLEMQKAVDAIIKDNTNTSDKYDFASDENVLDRFRPLMDERNLLLIPRVESAEVREGATRTGTTRYFTELQMIMEWVDVETDERLAIPWYGQGVDLAGEKGVGKALTYAEKYFLLKFFHVPTKKDDPDNDQRGASGEKKQKGSQAAKETTDFQRKASKQILDEIFGEDEDKKKAAVLYYTKNDQRGYAGVESVDKVSDAALPVVYAKLKKEYAKRTQKEFEYKQGDEE